MLNADQIVMAIAIKVIGFGLGQIFEWLKKRLAKRKHRRKPKTRRRH